MPRARKKRSTLLGSRGCIAKLHLSDHVRKAYVQLISLSLSLSLALPLSIYIYIYIIIIKYDYMAIHIAVLFQHRLVPELELRGAGNAA